MHLWIICYRKSKEYIMQNIVSIIGSSNKYLEDINIISDRQTYDMYINGIIFTNNYDIDIAGHIAIFTRGRSVGIINHPVYFYTSDIEFDGITMEQRAIKRYMILKLSNYFGHKHILMVDDNVSGFEGEYPLNFDDIRLATTNMFHRGNIIVGFFILSI